MPVQLRLLFVVCALFFSSVLMPRYNDTRKALLQQECPVCKAIAMENGGLAPAFDHPLNECPGQDVAAEISADADPNEEPPGPEKRYFKLMFGDSTFEIANRFRIESIYGVNLRFLNDDNNAKSPQLDKILYPGRHTLDTWFLYTYGRQSKGYDIVKAQLGLRNRGTWGAEDSILPTSSTRIKHVDAIIGDHDHAITRHVFWARELWVEFVLNDICGFNSKKRHTFTLGLFPFQLGRGISLGDAFEIDPDFIGFYTTNAIDQFAPGFKLTGELIAPGVLSYDIYVEIADNLSDSFTIVNQPINGQRKGRRFDPARGFGTLDYIIAARLLWNPYNEKNEKLQIEPYALYFNDKEQKIEFEGDARMQLGTIGLAVEYECGAFEAGFDSAVNIGVQDVFAWDKNVVKEENRDGFDVYVYDNVKTVSNKGRNALKTPDAADKVNRSVFSQECNGEEIKDECIMGANGAGDALFNSLNRFNDAYKNSILAGLFIFDMAYTFECDIKLAATAGFATGDDDPNKDLQSIGESNVDQDFGGFIGLQELYSGERVRSLFLLAGKGRPPRLLSVPAFKVVEEFPRRVRRFTNLVLTGGGFTVTPTVNCIPIEFNTNVLAFWTWKTPRIFTVDDITQEVTEKRASKFLGVEWNVIIEAEIFKDLTLVGNAAVFFPGSFYTDFKGIPLSKAERDFLKSIAEPNQASPVLRVPVLGNDISYFLYAALEYKF